MSGASSSSGSSRSRLTRKQKDLIKAQTRLAKRKLGLLQNEREFQEDFLQPEFQEIAAEQLVDQDRLKLDAEITQFVRDDLRGKFEDVIEREGEATPEEIARIDRFTNQIVSKGRLDLQGAEQRGFGLLTSELGRGGQISDRSGEIAEAGGAQRELLKSNAAGINARARLNLPLATGKLAADSLSPQQQIAFTRQAFARDLAARSAQARLGTLGSGIEAGLGIANASSVPFAGLGPLSSSNQSSFGFSLGGEGGSAISTVLLGGV